VSSLWSPLGLERLLWFTAIYWFVSAILIWLRPRWFLPICAGLALAYTVFAVGFRGPAAVLFFLVSCWAIAEDVLLGIAIWATAVMVLVHFPVNYAWVYAALFLLPLIIRRPRWNLRFQPDWTRLEFAALAALIFALALQWLVALKPEVGADALAMHLAAPAQVAFLHKWPFDITQFIWALMPMGGDWAYTAVYLLGGEFAARLLNFALLVLLSILLYETVRQWLGVTASLLMTALFASTPLVQLETGSLFIENYLACMVFGAVTNVARNRPYHAAIFCGAALAAKFGAVAFVLPIMIVALLRGPWKQRLAFAGLVILFGVSPYAEAYARTKNPIFPFLNTKFHSPLYDTTTDLRNQRYLTPLTWKTPYEVTFHSSKYLEAQDGSIGFAYFYLLPLALLGLRRKDAWIYLAVAVIGFAGTFSEQSYLRYVYPSLPLFIVAIAAGAAVIERVACMLAAVLIAINVYFLPASNSYHRDFFINYFDRGDVDRYLAANAPDRRAVEYINKKNARPRVAFLETVGSADLQGTPFLYSWHSDSFWRALQQSQSPEDDLNLMRKFGIDYFVAPASPVKRVYTGPFLKRFTEPEYTFAGYSAYRWKAIPSAAQPPPSAAKGDYDDLNPSVEYQGIWTRDTHFDQPAGGTLAYSNQKGASATFHFTGKTVTLVYTKAPNRGRAAITIDGTNEVTLDQYNAETRWQSRWKVSVFPAGEHQLKIRVLGEKSEESSDVYVDIDRFIVE